MRSVTGRSVVEVKRQVATRNSGVGLVTLLITIVAGVVTIAAAARLFPDGPTHGHMFVPDKPGLMLGFVVSV